jgi:alpha-L-rhamnosidase
VRILTDTAFPGWAFIIKSGGTFTWETWTPSDLIGDSMSHGWGSSALVAVQEALLGVVPALPSPGGPPTLVTVTPPTGGLTHASGTFPTPAGEYSVAWRSAHAGSGVQITVPPNAGALCRLAGSRVSEAGVPVEKVPGVDVVSRADGEVVVAVGAGTYDLTVSAG